MLCGSPCPFNCTNPDGQVQCSDDCIEGCFCKTGYLRNNNGTCVTIAECGGKLLFMAYYVKELTNILIISGYRCSSLVGPSWRREKGPTLRVSDHGLHTCTFRIQRPAVCLETKPTHLQFSVGIYSKSIIMYHNSSSYRKRQHLRCKRRVSVLRHGLSRNLQATRTHSLRVSLQHGMLLQIWIREGYC